MSLGEGFEVAFRGVVGECSTLENKGKGGGGGEGGGGGLGTGKGTGKSMRMRLSKLLFSDLPFSPSLKLVRISPLNSAEQGLSTLISGEEAPNTH